MTNWQILNSMINGVLVFRTSRRYFSSRWFYAIDIPKTKPFEPSYVPATAPTKFQPFSKVDSKRIEENYVRGRLSKRVDVNEDHLFEVNLQDFSMNPIYWEGPSYEIRRGIWFDDQNNPLTHELTNYVEDLYRKWLARGGRGSPGDIGPEKKNADDDDHEQEVLDTFRLPKGSRWKYIMFTEDNKTAFLLPDVYGGNLHLNLLRSSVAQLVQIGASKITRGYEQKSVSLKGKAKELEGQVLDHAIGLSKISDMISWEFKDLMNASNAQGVVNSNASQNASGMMKDEISKDYQNNDGGERSHYRRIKHLVFCVHGIGQTLGKKYEYVNFAHTVNLLRNNIKSLYQSNGQLQELNALNEFQDPKNNSAIQVLPITWRHAIGFSTDDANVNTDNEDLPTLNDVTVDGIKPLRKLLADIGLDILLYGDNYYVDKILKYVCAELNSVYEKYCDHNPEFDGKVSLLGHSLGSLILFDMLSQQSKYRLNFEVENFFTIGSPVGVFKLIQRTKIGESDSLLKQQTPACKNYYNLYHPCDPVAYRVEPLIEKSMAKYEAKWISHANGSDFIADTVKNLILDKNSKKKEQMSSRVLKRMLQFNDNGRVDYSFQPNLLDVDVWSAIKSHVSYFEEMDTAGFLLKELLKKHVKAKSCEVTVLKSTETTQDTEKS